MSWISDFCIKRWDWIMDVVGFVIVFIGLIIIRMIDGIFGMIRDWEDNE